MKKQSHTAWLMSLVRGVVTWRKNRLITAKYGSYCIECVCASGDCENGKNCGDCCRKHVCQSYCCDNEKEENSDYCSDCKCGNCENEARKGEIYCNDCVCSAYDCENLANSSSGLCDSCECSNCESEAVEDGLCRECWEAENKVIYDADEDVLHHFSADKVPNDGFLAGVELEVECRNLRRDAEDVKDYVDNHAILKEDGSLSDGFEIVTRPMTQANHEKFWNWLDKQDSDIHIKDTCGLHVHVSRKGLTQLALGKILVFINAEENREFVTAIAGRESAEYAKLEKKKISDGKGNSTERYEAVNTTNYATIEFRIFRASLEKSEVMRAVEFSLAVCRWAKYSAGINELALVDFYRFVIADKKTYPNLFSFIKLNAQRFWDAKRGNFVQLPQINNGKQLELFN